MPDSFREAVVGFVEQVRTVNAHVDVDAKAGQLALRLTVKPKPGGPLEGFFEYAATGRSAFVPLLEKADGGLVFHLPGPKDVPEKPLVLSPRDRALFAKMFRVPGVSPEVVGSLFQTLIETFGHEGFNGVALLSVREKGDHSLVLGLRIRNGRKLDAALRDLHKNLPPELKKQLPVEWNHDRHGAARIHRLRVPDEEGEIYLAIRDDVVLLFFDKESTRLLKSILDQLDTKAPPLSKLLHVRAGSRLLLSNEGVRKLAEKELSASEREKLSAELTVTGGKELTIGLRLPAQLLRLLVLEARQ
jgi:hypothetical protein